MTSRCPWCGKVLGKYLLKTHEGICNLRPKQSLTDAYWGSDRPDHESLNEQKLKILEVADESSKALRNRWHQPLSEGAPTSSPQAARGGGVPLVHLLIQNKFSDLPQSPQRAQRRDFITENKRKITTSPKNVSSPKNSNPPWRPKLELPTSQFAQHVVTEREVVTDFSNRNFQRSSQNNSIGGAPNRRRPHSADSRSAPLDATFLKPHKSKQSTSSGTHERIFAKGPPLWPVHPGPIATSSSQLHCITQLSQPAPAQKQQRPKTAPPPTKVPKECLKFNDTAKQKLRIVQQEIARASGWDIVEPLRHRTASTGPRRKT